MEVLLGARGKWMFVMIQKELGKGASAGEIGGTGAPFAVVTGLTVYRQGRRWMSQMCRKSGFISSAACRKTCY